MLFGVINLELTIENILMIKCNDCVTIRNLKKITESFLSLPPLPQGREPQRMPQIESQPVQVAKAN